VNCSPCLDARNPADAIAMLAHPLWGFKRGRPSFTHPARSLIRQEI